MWAHVLLNATAGDVEITWINILLSIALLAGGVVLLKGRKEKKRHDLPGCNTPMTPGFVQARGEVYFAEKPHKLFFAAKGNDIVLTQHNYTAPTCMAYLCLVCRKVVIEYDKRL